jgi:hypothetical protein
MTTNLPPVLFPLVRLIVMTTYLSIDRVAVITTTLSNTVDLVMTTNPSISNI